MAASALVGLGPDEVTFKAWRKDEKRGLWINHVLQWQKQNLEALEDERGDADAVPPGVRDGEPLRGDAGERDYYIRNDQYQLRPEVCEEFLARELRARSRLGADTRRAPTQTVESLYVLFKTTGDPVWRDRAWEIFEAIRKHTRLADGGYASVSSLTTSDPPYKSNAMPRYARGCLSAAWFSCVQCSSADGGFAGFGIAGSWRKPSSTCTWSRHRRTWCLWIAGCSIPRRIPSL